MSFKNRRPATLTPQRRRFAVEWLRTSNATESAIAAGYSAKTARQIGSRLLTSVDVQQFLAGRVTQVEIERDRLVLEIAQQAFEPVPDMGDFVDDYGNFKPLHELTPTQRRCIQGLDYVKRNLATGDKKRADVVKLRLANIRAERVKAQELLARVMGWIRTGPPPPPLVPLFHIASLPPLTALPTVSRERRDGPPDREVP